MLILFLGSLLKYLIIIVSLNWSFEFTKMSVLICQLIFYNQWMNKKNIN